MVTPSEQRILVVIGWLTAVGLLATMASLIAWLFFDASRHWFMFSLPLLALSGTWAGMRYRERHAG